MKKKPRVCELMHADTNKTQEQRDAERAARAKNVAEARASVELEGYTLSDAVLAISQQYIDGKITVKEHMELIRALDDLPPGKE